MKIFLISVLLIPVMFSCKSKTKSDRGSPVDQKQVMLFDILTPEQTGIYFENKITETLSMNGLFYEYYYNGGGLAIADFNNDDLQDVYFIANLHPNKLYLNMGNLKFKDISKESGTADHIGFSTGVTAVDINNDGWMDIYISNSGRFDPERLKNKLFVNQGINKDGIPIFKEESSKYGLDIALCSTQAAFLDYDRDNDLDMFLINHYPDIYNVSEIEKLLKTESTVTGDRLYQNQNGKFIDVSKKAGIVNNELSYGLGVGISDLNNDGWPDVYVSTDYSGKDFLYVNNRNGTFTECINRSLKHISLSSMGNYLADLNNDGWSDIVTLDMMAEENYGIKASYGFMDFELFTRLVDLGQHHQYMYNTLQLNRGILIHDQIPAFSDIAQLAGISSTDWSWGPLLFDMDNDGLKDIFVANGIMRDFINNDYLMYFEKSYKEVIETGKVIKDEFITSVLSQMPRRKKSDYFFRNRGDLTFEKMNGEWVRDMPTCSNGAAYADLDNDGDMDIILNNSAGPSFIYQNKAREIGLGNYLQFKLTGPEKNPLGMGTKIIIKQKGQLQVQEQYLTRGYLSSVSPVLHFGLGSDTVVPEIQVIWPDGKVQIITNYTANQTLSLSYLDAGQMHEPAFAPPDLFVDVTHIMKLFHKHEENSYNDFSKESLLPHKMSDLGPGLAISDVNKDGLEDFYIGGALCHPGRLFIQTKDGFIPSPNQPWTEDRQCEDIKASFFDADRDGDPDLYVVSGGNEYEEGNQFLQDRLYMNTGQGSFEKMKEALPDMTGSGSCVIPADYDGDGDLDLFVGGRQIPGKYPLPASSKILRNDSKPGSVRFTDVSSSACPQLTNMGMVSDAVFTDINGDDKLDLVVVGEWMPVRVFKNNGNKFEDITDQAGLSEETGWWNCVTSADFDHDGDMDLVAGNLGLNCKYKSSMEHPFEIYSKDFDNNGRLDIVLGYYNADTLYPLHGLKKSSDQLPFIRQKFKTHDAFAKATLEDVYGTENLKSARNYKAGNFASCYMENIGNGTYRIKPLDNPAQISSVQSIIKEDIDLDGILDLVIAGNTFGIETETPRIDAGIGLYLKGDGTGNFKPVTAAESGLLVDGDVREIHMIHLGVNKTLGIIAVKNDDFLQVIKINNHK